MCVDSRRAGWKGNTAFLFAARLCGLMYLPPMTLLNLHRVLFLSMVVGLRVFAQEPSAGAPPAVITVTTPPNVLPTTTGALDGGVLEDVSGPDFTADLAALTADPTNVEVYVRLAMHAVVTGQWALLVSLILTLLVAGLRKWVPEAWKLGAWLRTKLGGIVSSFSLSLGFGFVTALLSGQPFSVAVVLKALQIALGASGSWAIYKNIKEAINEKKAAEAGAAAAATPGATLDK